MKANRGFIARCKQLLSLKNRKASLNLNTTSKASSFGIIFFGQINGNPPLSEWWREKSMEKTLDRS